jgi:hypothetical protein
MTKIASEFRHGMNSASKHLSRKSLSKVAFLLILTCACGAYAGDTTGSPTAITPSYDARLRMLYDYRAQGGERDTDFYGYWSGGGRNIWNGRIDIYASGRLHRDMDQPTSSSLADDMYLSVSDAGGVTENRLFQIYLDAHDRTGRMHVSAGRQYIDVADYLHLDGVRASLFEYGRMGCGGFYGKPVSFYVPLGEDEAWGMFVVGRPWDGNRTRLTYSRYASTNGNDGNYHLDLQQTVSDTVRARAQISILNEEFRMGSLDFYYFAADGETDAYLGASHWGRFDAETRAYSPFYDVLGTLQPYTYAYARTTLTILPHVAVSPGASARFAENGGGPSSSNKDYFDYDLLLTYEPTKAFSASVSADYWDVDGGDGFFSVSGDVRYRRGKIWELSLGSSHSKYTYLTYSDLPLSVNGGQTVSDQGSVVQETPFTYTYYLRAKWNVRRSLTLRLQCDVEDDSDATDLAYRGRASIEVRL